VNVEQQLTRALRTADRIEPSTDLWSRVVHSIEEDRAHRRRVRIATVATTATVACLVVIGAVGSIDGPLGRFVRPPVMEAIETALLVALVIILGPAIRRFGRGYADDLWTASPTTPTALLRLLDVAYLLVFTGFILLTAEFEPTGTVPTRRIDCFAADIACHAIGDQLESAAQRVGGLLLTMGILHAITLAALPAVALVSNSTRLGRRLPRWLVIAFTVLVVLAAIQVLPALVALIIGAGGS
jgi:hypothetical protein